MQRKASFAVVSALAAATAASPAQADSHYAIAATLANYTPQIEAVQDAALKAELNQRAELLQGYFAICSTANGHTPELYALMEGQLAEIGALLGNKAPQTEVAMAPTR